MLVSVCNPTNWRDVRSPSLGLAYLASSIRKNLPGIKFSFRIVNKNILSEANKFHPHLIGLSTFSPSFQYAIHYINEFAVREIPIILGGPHISALPHCLPKNATAAVLGEGEVTFTELVKTALDGPLTPSKLSSIKGIAFWDKDTLIETEARPRIQNLDILSLPARDLIPIHPYTSMITSRGCPYRCTFCITSPFWDTVRYHSPEYVGDEVEMLVQKFKVKFISFYDDLFIGKQERLAEIIHILEKRGLLGKISFSCNARADLINDKLIWLLVRLGVKYVTMGLESGDDETLKYLKGEDITVSQNQHAIQILQKNGVKINAYFIIGSPLETQEKLDRTYNFIRKANIDLISVNCLTPFPGTPVWEYAKENGFVSEESFDWSLMESNVPGFHQNFNKFLCLSRYLSKEQLFKQYKRFRRLETRRNFLRIWKHPLRGYILGMTFKIAQAYLRNRLRNSQQEVKISQSHSKTISK